MLKRIKMPSAYSSSQKQAISSFVGSTQVKDSVAAKVSLATFNVELGGAPKVSLCSQLCSVFAERIADYFGLQ